MLHAMRTVFFIFQLYSEFLVRCLLFSYCIIVTCGLKVIVYYAVVPKSKILVWWTCMLNIPHFAQSGICNLLLCKCQL